MKYQSELIKEIVDKRGHVKSSIHYQSECVNEWIEENKGAYPKLCDYQSEWLYYINENPIGEFPYVTLLDVTEATVNNVVPYEYKSAILKGQTLVNLIKSVDKSAGVYTKENEYHIIEHKSDTNYISFKLKCRYKLDTTKNYMLFMNVKENTLTSVVRTTTPSLLQDKTLFDGGFVGVYKLKFSTSDSNNDFIWLRTNSGSSGKLVFSCMVLEYQDGMENWDIPYFTGMQSVKMPVLTTTGKNLCPPMTIGGIYDTTGKEFANETLLRSDFIELDTTITISTNNFFNRIFGYDENKNFIKLLYSDSTGVAKKTINVESRIKYIRVRAQYSEDFTIQIEQGAVATSYEPFKSNILTVNEPVELRGIGDVSDTLDCLTGEVTERIGEVVLDGSEGERWAIYTNNREKTVQFRFDMKSTAKGQSNYTKIISNNLPNVDIINNNDTEGVSIYSNGNIYISLLRTKATTLSDLNLYLQSNPITIQYELAEKSIKTVDLTIEDQNGNALRKIKPIEGTMHLSTDGETIKPTFTGEIPVEAITQNLASFIEE